MSNKHHGNKGGSTVAQAEGEAPPAKPEVIYKEATSPPEQPAGLVPVDDGNPEAYLDMPGDGASEGHRYGRLIPYTGWTKGEERIAALKEAGVSKNTFYHADALGIIAMNPCKLLVTPCFFRCYVKKDDGGQITDVRLRAAGGWRPSYGDGWQNHTISLVVAILPGNAGAKLAFFDTSNALDKIWDTLKGAIDAAADPKRPDGVSVEDHAAECRRRYAARGGKYVEAAESPRPWGRFVASVWITEEQNKTNAKKTHAAGHVSVSQATEWNHGVLREIISSGAMKAAADTFGRRKARLERMAAETAAKGGAA